MMIKNILDKVSAFPALTQEQIVEAFSNIECSDHKSASLFNKLRQVDFDEYFQLEITNAFNIDEAYFSVLLVEYFKLLVILNKNKGLIVPENYICEFWKMHIVHDIHYLNLTSQIFGEYLIYSGSSVTKEEIDVEANYDILVEQYRNIFGNDPIGELWRPLNEEDETLIKVNLFNLITWEITLLSYRI